jgi:hypothetical protein
VLKETLASQEAINQVRHEENLELRKEWTLEKQKYMDDLEKQTREVRKVASSHLDDRVDGHYSYSSSYKRRNSEL